MPQSIPFFSQLCEHPSPFRWQERLYADLVEGRCPALINLPTGMGKTSLMQLWLLALAAQAECGPQFVSLPRRLAWVVDRRVVVDQATDEAERIAEKLQTSIGLLEVRRALSVLSGDEEEPLAVSTLRGERADNRQWSENPSRAAIIVGTVDMIGSRLLFSGYGLSGRMRARQAGLLSHDTLLVNDEAHLTPVFARLVEEIQSCVQAEAGERPPLRIVRLSATQRGGAGKSAFPGDLAEDEAASEVFRKRLNAQKQLALIESDDSKAIEKLASESTGRTVVFVRSPERARKVATAIRRTRKLDGEVPLITGEQRGWERDELITKEAFLHFTEGGARGKDCWLVATSAGEVGINISCDHLITELDTADHLLQRFGRLNRFGETQGRATVVYSAKLATSQRASAAERATFQYLQSLAGDVSPKALMRLPPGTECLSSEPKRAPLLPWLIDVWSMTSLKEKDWPSRPEVGPWLRGADEEGPPETYVCWRHDAQDLTQETVSDGDRDEVFHSFPILAKERLKQRTDRLCEALEKSPHGDRKVLLIGRDRTVTPVRVRDVIAVAQRARLHYATLVVPPGLGALDSNGTVDWSEAVSEGEEGWDRFDVSEILDGERKRIKVGPGGDDSRAEGLIERQRVSLAQEDETEEAACWRYYTASKSRGIGQIQSLEEHQRLVRERAVELGGRLFGPRHLCVEILRWAADRHDLGKDCEVWQRYARRTDDQPPLAKSAKFMHPAALAGYRHELGSLLDAKSAQLDGLSKDDYELALHLIASHHGCARPHFVDSAMDKRQVLKSREVALESARRFSRLQRRYGAWGLAYLEALFCAADAQASRESPEDPAHA